MKYIIPLLIFAACSSTPDKKNKPAVEAITNESFKKERPLKSSEVADFYKGNAHTLTPALQDETLDRYSPAELSNLNVSDDPLMEISLLCSNGDYSKAFEVAGRSFNRYQKVAAYWNQVANCHLNAGSYRKALLFYNKALEVSPNYTPALNNIGVMYSRQGQNQKALIAFERAGNKSKFSKTPRYNLAKLYLAFGLTESALPVFESLLRESPADVDILNAVASSHFLLSDYQRALSYYQKIPQNLWSRAEIGLNLAWTLSSAGRNDEGLRVLKDVEIPSSGNLKEYYRVVENHIGAK